MNRLLNLLFRRAGVVLAVYWVALFIGTHVPKLPRVTPRLPHFDKLLHFSAYAGLAFLLAAVFTMRRSMSTGRYVAIFIGLAVYAALDELIQSIPGLGRQADPLDWVADVCGVTVGLLVFAAAAEMARRLGLALLRGPAIQGEPVIQGEVAIQGEPVKELEVR